MGRELSGLSFIDRAELQDRIRDLRKQFSTEYPSGFFPDFEDWVRKTRGKEAAEQYRYSGKTKDILAEIRPVEPVRSKDPEPRDIRDCLPEVFGREVRYSNARGQTAFVDSGPKISVMDHSEASVLAALQLARQKYGKDLVVSGPKEFQEKVIRLAVRNNIAIANPELQQRVQEEKDRIAAEREQQRQKDRDSPSPIGGVSAGATKKTRKRSGDLIKSAGAGASGPRPSEGNPKSSRRKAGRRQARFLRPWNRSRSSIAGRSRII